MIQLEGRKEKGIGENISTPTQSYLEVLAASSEEFFCELFNLNAQFLNQTPLLVKGKMALCYGKIICVPCAKIICGREGN